LFCEKDVYKLILKGDFMEKNIFLGYVASIKGIGMNEENVRTIQE
jgi:hypothetical protein